MDHNVRTERVDLRRHAAGRSRPTLPGRSCGSRGTSKTRRSLSEQAKTAVISSLTSFAGLAARDGHPSFLSHL